MSEQIKIWQYRLIDGGGSIILDFPTQGDNYILLGEGFAEINPLDKDPDLAEAEVLERAKTRMMADHQLALDKIDERIQSLLAITHDKAP